MGQLTFGDPVPGQANSSEEPKIPTALDAIKTWANGATPGTPGGGNIDTDNLKGTFLKKHFLAKIAAGGVNWNITFGNGSFTGDGSATHSIPVAHGLPAGSNPQFIVCLCALAVIGGSTTPWTSSYGEYAAADSVNFYMQFEQWAYAPSAGGGVTEWGFISGSTYYFNFMAIGN